jgi:hypothetical protein
MERFTLTLFLAVCTVYFTFADSKSTIPSTNLIKNSQTVSILEDNPGKEFDFSVLSLTSGTLTIKIKLPKDELAYLYFEDKNNIPVMTKSIKLVSGEEFLTYDISDLIGNSYRLTLASSSKKISKTILIPR